jgi:hypothetical protein
MIRATLLTGLALVGLVAAPAAAAPSIVSASRSTSVYAYTFDYYFGDVSAEDADAAGTTAYGAFTSSLDASATLLSGGGFSAAAQDTTINRTALSFSGTGSASSGLYVQATGAPATIGDADSTFDLTFRLRKAGGLSLYSYLAAYNPGTIQGADSTATATVRVVNTATGAVAFSRAVVLGQEDEFDDVIALPAGRYRLEVRASAFSTSGAGGEFIEEGRADFQISGQIFEN